MKEKIELTEGKKAFFKNESFLFKNFSSVVRDRFKKSVDRLPLGDGFDHETQRSGTSGNWSCRAGEEQRWAHGSISNGGSFFLGRLCITLNTDTPKCTGSQ